MGSEAKNISFLEQLAGYLLAKHGSDLGNITVLFPNRRAGLFFRNYLSRQSDQAMWLPSIQTISAFMEELSSYELAEPLQASFELYKLYSGKQQNPVDFDEFFYQGEMMLRDFDDIDKYLVNANDLFTNISDLKEVDNVFDYLTDEQKELISRFWKFFDAPNLSGQKDSFLKVWKLLGPLYNELQDKLAGKGIAYEGMLYRDVAERIQRDGFVDISSDKVFICGFNALNNAEKTVFRFLQQSGKAEFYWDYDTSYIENQSMEAGRFLRSNLMDFPPDKDFDPGFNNLGKEKTLNVYSLPSDILQAKFLYNKLEEEKDEDIKHFGHTAVILGDENLLPPVIRSIPDNIDHLNVTMGYPMKNTTVFSFVDNLLKLQRNNNRQGDFKGFYFRDVLSILNHQYLQNIHHEKVKGFLKKINDENLVYVKSSDIPEDELFNKVFVNVSNPGDLSGYLLEILEIIAGFLIQKNASDEADFMIESEYLFQLKTRLTLLSSLISESIEITGTVEAYMKLFRKIIQGHRIPFAGEPLRGLQIMGILESRILDFDHVIFLSLNEGVMPVSYSGFSFVPANLRFAVGMPTREDHDAIYAYYFFRLIQRASRITIMYNNSTEGMKTGEPGRYLYQLEYLSNYKINKHTVSFNVSGSEPKDIVITKDDRILERLSRFKTDGKHYLSPSAITSYMDCPLRFYFSYVEGIREEDEVMEDLDYPAIGDFYHTTMELIYKEYEGCQLSDKDFKKMKVKENVEEKMSSAFRAVFAGNKEGEIRPEGNNIIVYEIIKQLVIKTLEIDEKIDNLSFIKAEETLRYQHQCKNSDLKVWIGGKIDRIDERNGIIHLIDYKTGKVTRRFESAELLFNRNEWKSANLKGAVQILIYSWLYQKHFPEAQQIAPGIYSTREMFDKSFNFLLEEGRRNSLRSVMNASEYFHPLEDSLDAMISELFNPEIPFRQTEDEKICSHCIYASICHRNTKKEGGY